MTNVKQVFTVLLSVAMVMGLIGCESKPRLGEFTVTVSLSSDFAQGGSIPPTEVDLIGLPAAELSTAQNTSVSTYFQPLNPYRQSLVQGKDRVTLVFRDGDSGPKTVELNRKGKDRDTWQHWYQRGVVDMVVLADLRGPGISDQPGDADFRRFTLTLDKARWKGRGNLNIVVQPARVYSASQPEPQK